MSELNWQTPPAGAWRAPEEVRDLWAGRLIADQHQLFVESGDSLVIACRDPQTGVIDLYDCLIRRTARIASAPSEHGRDAT